jgi:hypothetical protein
VSIGEGGLQAQFARVFAGTRVPINLTVPNSSGALPKNRIRPMILVIGQTLVNLSPGQVWKAPHNVIDGGTVDDQTDHGRAPQSECPPRSHCPSDFRQIDQVMVTSRWRADLVLTGEGSLDGQTLEGKAPAGVAAMARRLVPDRLSCSAARLRRPPVSAYATALTNSRRSRT